MALSSLLSTCRKHELRAEAFIKNWQGFSGMELLNCSHDIKTETTDVDSCVLRVQVNG